MEHSNFLPDKARNVIACGYFLSLHIPKLIPFFAVIVTTREPGICCGGKAGVKRERRELKANAFEVRTGSGGASSFRMPTTYCVDRSPLSR
jgi:hypothetical protein